MGFAFYPNTQMEYSLSLISVKNNMNIFQTSYFWLFCFSIIFFLSLDFWSWKPEISFSVFYLPPWVIYFLGLQIILSLTLLVFTLHFWKTPPN